MKRTPKEPGAIRRRIECIRQVENALDAVHQVYPQVENALDAVHRVYLTGVW